MEREGAMADGGAGPVHRLGSDGIYEPISAIDRQYQPQDNLHGLTADWAGPPAEDLYAVINTDRKKKALGDRLSNDDDIYATLEHEDRPRRNETSFDMDSELADAAAPPLPERKPSAVPTDDPATRPALPVRPASMAFAEAVVTVPETSGRLSKDEKKRLKDEEKQAKALKKQHAKDEKAKLKENAKLKKAERKEEAALRKFETKRAKSPKPRRKA